MQGKNLKNITISNFKNYLKILFYFHRNNIGKRILSKYTSFLLIDFEIDEALAEFRMTL